MCSVIFSNTKIAAKSLVCRSEIKTCSEITMTLVILSRFTIWTLKKRRVCFVLQKQRIFDNGYLENHKIVF